MRLAQSLDPLSLWIGVSLSTNLYLMGRDEQAVEQLQKVLEMDAHYYPARFCFGMIHLRRGRLAETVAEFQKARQAEECAPRGRQRQHLREQLGARPDRRGHPLHGAQLEINFRGEKKVDEVSVFTLQDAFSAPAEPTETITFSLYGVTSFDVEYWNGSQWVTVQGGINGNNKVWRRLTFAEVTTTKLRVRVDAALDARRRLNTNL